MQMRRFGAPRSDSSGLERLASWLRDHYYYSYTVNLNGMQYYSVYTTGNRYAGKTYRLRVTRETAMSLRGALAVTKLRPHRLQLGVVKEGGEEEFAFFEDQGGKAASFAAREVLLPTVVFLGGRWFQG